VVLGVPCSAQPEALRQRFDAAVRRWAARRNVRVGASPYAVCPEGRGVVAPQADAVWNALGAFAGAHP